MQVPTEAGNEVVGFVTVLAEQRYVEQLDDLANPVDLAGKLIRHLRAVGFVLLELLVAKGGPFKVGGTRHDRRDHRRRGSPPHRARQ